MNTSKNISTIFLSFFISLFFWGCSSSVSHVPIDSLGTLQEPRKRTIPIGKLTVKFSPEAKKEETKNLAFNIDKLKLIIQKKLEEANMLKLTQDPAPQIEVQITNLRIRSSLTAAFWGPFAGADSLKGEVTILSVEGKPEQKFMVSSSYALGGLAASDSMNWLYDNFSKEILKELEKN